MTISEIFLAVFSLSFTSTGLHQIVYFVTLTANDFIFLSYIVPLFDSIGISLVCCSDGGGKIAYLPGYRLGGKTGTAQKVIDGVYAQGKYICSFISVAPVDDPQIVVLAIVDEPTDVVAFGSTTAGPIIKEVMSQSLEYLGVKKEYTKEEKEENEKKQVEIPDVRNLTIKEATKILEEKKLESNLDTDIEVDEKKVVTDMFPKPGVKVNEGSSIILYYNNN